MMYNVAAMNSCSVLVGGLLLGSYSICWRPVSRSEEPDASRPGVNKGNVDNKANGPHYYYFYAGPGHVDIHYAFQGDGRFWEPIAAVA